MEHIDVSNLSLGILGAEIFRFVIRTTDLKDPVDAPNSMKYDHMSSRSASPTLPLGLANEHDICHSKRNPIGLARLITSFFSFSAFLSTSIWGLASCMIWRLASCMIWRLAPCMMKEWMNVYFFHHVWSTFHILGASCDQYFPCFPAHPIFLLPMAAQPFVASSHFDK